jgi:hypothetical protein
MMVLAKWCPLRRIMLERKVGTMHLSEAACEILDLFRAENRKPGARILIGTLDANLGTEPVIAAAVSELTDHDYVIARDADTVELTDRGFDAVQRGDYRQPHH